MKSLHLGLFVALLLAAGSITVWAQAAQQTGDQTKTDSSTGQETGKKGADSAATLKKNSSKNSTAPSAATAPASKPAATPAAGVPASPPASKTATTPKAPPANSGGMVWVNSDSGVYHKPGTRWYGKTKQGKYMTEADAIKAGYHAAKKE